MKLGTPGRTLNVGVIGLGFRGMPQLKLLLSMEDVNVVAVCDVFADRVEKAQEKVKEARGSVPFGTGESSSVSGRSSSSV